MEKEKFTFRQKWFPTFDDAEALEQASSDSCFAIGIGQLIGRWARSVVLAGALAGALVWAGYQGIGNGIEYSQGTRTGMINKISEKGLFWKTYEGQIALEGIVSGNNSVGANVWDFSLDRQARHGENPKELTEKIRGYLETGTKVKVTYIEPMATWPWRSETDYLIQSVEPVGKTEKQ